MLTQGVRGGQFSTPRVRVMQQVKSPFRDLELDFRLM